MAAFNYQTPHDNLSAPLTQLGNDVAYSMTSGIRRGGGGYIGDDIARERETYQRMAINAEKMRREGARSRAAEAEKQRLLKNSMDLGDVMTRRATAAGIASGSIPIEYVWQQPQDHPTQEGQQMIGDIGQVYRSTITPDSLKDPAKLGKFAMFNRALHAGPEGDLMNDEAAFQMGQVAGMDMGGHGINLADRDNLIRGKLLNSIINKADFTRQVPDPPLADGSPSGTTHEEGMSPAEIMASVQMLDAPQDEQEEAPTGLGDALMPSISVAPQAVEAPAPAMQPEGSIGEDFAPVLETLRSRIVQTGVDRTTGRRIAQLDDGSFIDMDDGSPVEIGE